MQTTLLILHNLIRWGVLLFGLWALLRALGGTFSNNIYTRPDNRAGLLFMTFCDIQLLVGLVLYFKNGWFEMLKNNFKATTENPSTRFFALEHMAMMILAWLLVHIGRSMVKKGATDKAKHKRSLVFYGIALLLILAAIPWPFREEIMRPWYRWFN